MNEGGEFLGDEREVRLYEWVAWRTVGRDGEAVATNFEIQIGDTRNREGMSCRY